MVYLMAFRLAVIAAGVVCVYLGYRLFLLGVMPAEGSDLSADARGVKLTVKNAAPGTCFAVFGACIIALMLWQGMPELRRIENSSGSALVLRGNAGETVAEALARGEALALRGDTPDAVRAYATTLSDPDMSLGDAAPLLVAIADLWCDEGRIAESRTYADLVHEIQPALPELDRLKTRLAASRNGPDDPAVEPCGDA